MLKEYQGSFNKNTNFQGFIKDEKLIKLIISKNKLSKIYTIFNDDNKQYLKIMYLAPFSTSLKYELILNNKFSEEKVLINLDFIKNKEAIAVINQQFLVGYYSKNCEIYTN